MEQQEGQQDAYTYNGPDSEILGHFSIAITIHLTG